MKFHSLKEGIIISGGDRQVNLILVQSPSHRIPTTKFYPLPSSWLITTQELDSYIKLE